MKNTIQRHCGANPQSPANKKGDSCFRRNDGGGLCEANSPSFGGGWGEVSGLLRSARNDGNN